MKSITQRLLLLLILLYGVMPLSVRAADSIRTVRVGFFQFKGYQETHPDGTRSGYGYDFLYMLQRYANIKFEFVGEDKSWFETLDMMRRGEIDLLTSMHKTQDRIQEFAFSHPIGDNSVNINIRKDDNRYAPYDFKHYNNMVVGLNKGSIIYDKLKSFARDNGFTFTPRFYASLDSLHLALLNHEVDALATSSLRSSRDEKTIARFDAQYFYAVVQKNDTSLLNIINNAITQMNACEDDWQSRLYYNNYVETEKSALDFTPEEMAYIRKHSTNENAIVITADNSWFPFCVRRDGKYVGIIPDYWNEIVRITGMKYRYYNNGHMVSDLDEVSRGKADLYMGPTPDHASCTKRGLMLSPIFMNVGVSLLYSTKHPDIRTVALCANTPFLNSVFKAEEGQVTKQYLDSDEALEALRKGEVDAVFCYAYDAERIRNNDPAGDLAYRTLPGTSMGLRAVTSINSDHMLMSIISKCIKRLQGSQTDAIISENLAFTASDFRLRDWFFLHPILSILIAFFILSIIAIAVILQFRLHLRNAMSSKLEDAIRKAETASKAKSDFLFSMSHDIRTPMNAIIGFANLMEKNQDNRELCKDYLYKIQQSSDFLLGLINNVLEMARIDSGKAALEEKPNNPQVMLEQLWSVFAELMKQKNIEFQIINGIHSHSVYFDEVKVNEIYLNLLSNALKYTPEGGKVTVNVQERPGEQPDTIIFRVTVTDTGVGMSPDFLPHLFEEFSREHTTTDNKIQGTGLGMPIVKKLVELMGGIIEVSSDLGKGTSITITTTHRIGNEQLQDDVFDKMPDTSIFAGKRILMAEDNELNAEIAIALLEEVGLIIDHAVDGADCIRRLADAPAHYYDLILMDIQMPNLNGYEATRKIRSMSDTAKANIPIFAMTANAFEEDRQNALDAGMNGHLAKPIDITILLKTIVRVLR